MSLCDHIHRGVGISRYELVSNINIRVKLLGFEMIEYTLKDHFYVNILQGQ